MSGIDMNKRENFFNELNALLIKHGVCIDSLATADDDSGLASEVCVYEIIPERGFSQRIIGSADGFPCELKDINNKPWFY